MHVINNHDWTLMNDNLKPKLEANKANAPIHIQMGQYKQQQQRLRNMHVIFKWLNGLKICMLKAQKRLKITHIWSLCYKRYKVRLVLIISLNLTFGHCVSSCINNANTYKYSLLKFCPYAKFDSCDIYCVWENDIDWTEADHYMDSYLSNFTSDTQ